MCTLFEVGISTLTKTKRNVQPGEMEAKVDEHPT